MGRPILVEFSPVTDFREATCRQYEENTCTRGGYCNFMHLRPISRDLRKQLFGRYKGSLGGVSRSDEPRCPFLPQSQSRSAVSICRGLNNQTQSQCSRVDQRTSALLFQEDAQSTCSIFYWTHFDGTRRSQELCVLSHHLLDQLLVIVPPQGQSPHIV